jgi:hypothetical protein
MTTWFICEAGELHGVYLTYTIIIATCSIYMVYTWYQVYTRCIPWTRYACSIPGIYLMLLLTTAVSLLAVSAGGCSHWAELQAELQAASCLQLFCKSAVRSGAAGITRTIWAVVRGVVSAGCWSVPLSGHGGLAAIVSFFTNYSTDSNWKLWKIQFLIAKGMHLTLIIGPWPFTSKMSLKCLFGCLLQDSASTLNLLND